ncbi:MAG: T9SS type A sorting domain-containing protein [Chitinophagales bacterium]
MHARFFVILLLCFLLGIPARAQVDVWPGDANNNGEVNHFDLLYFGMGYSYQGPPRLQKSVLFQAQNTLVWQQFLPDQTNFAFLDCNGSGHISLDDTIAIRLNYKEQHGSITPDRLSPISPNGDSLFMAIAADSVLNKSRIEIPIHLGSVAAPIDSFYGIAFSLNYDPQRIREASFSVKLDSAAWIKKSGALQDDPFLMYFEESNAGKLNIAVSKSSLVNAAGNGKLLIVSCVIEDNLIGKGFQALEFTFEDVLLISNNMNAKPIQVASKQVNIIPTNIEAISRENIDLKLYPNPASDYLMVKLAESNADFKWSIIDLNGKIHNVKAERSGGNYKIDIQDLSEGYYMLRIENEKYERYEKFIKF